MSLTGGRVNFLAYVFDCAVGFSSFAGGAKQVYKMRNFSYAFYKLTCKCAKGSVGSKTMTKNCVSAKIK